MSPEQEKLSEETGKQARVIMRDIKRLRLDCRSHSCQFAPVKSGVRTNGHCACIDNNPALRVLLRKLMLVIQQTPDEVFEEHP